MVPSAQPVCQYLKSVNMSRQQLKINSRWTILQPGISGLRRNRDVDTTPWIRIKLSCLKIQQARSSKLNRQPEKRWLFVTMKLTDLHNIPPEALKLIGFQREISRMASSFRLLQVKMHTFAPSSEKKGFSRDREILLSLPTPSRIKWCRPR